jgi:hypothetical protein
MFDIVVKRIAVTTDTIERVAGGGRKALDQPVWTDPNRCLMCSVKLRVQRFRS